MLEAIICSITLHRIHVKVVLLFVWVLRRFQQFFSHITTQTLDMIPHPVTLSWHWVDQSQLYPVNLSAKRGAASTIFNDFGMSRPGIEPRTSRSPEQTLYLLSYRGRYRLKIWAYNLTVLFCHPFWIRDRLVLFFHSEGSCPVWRGFFFFFFFKQEADNRGNLHFQLFQTHWVDRIRPSSLIRFQSW